MSIDAQSLLDELPHQRWFGFKDSRIAGIGVVDEAVIDDGPPALVIAIVAVDVAGRSVWYQLPLLVDSDGTLRDATTEPERLRVLGELMRHSDSIKGDHGVFYFGGPGLDPMAPPLGRSSVRVMDAEQSNTSVVFDEEVILKFFRKLDRGPNPDLELNRLLTNEGFDHIPAQVGEITYEGEIDEEEIVVDLGIAQQLVSGGAEGWTYLVAELHRFFDEIDPADVPEDHRFLTEERAKQGLEAIEELGDVTAALHVALSRNEVDPDLVPEAIQRSDLDDLAARISQSLSDAPPDALKGIAKTLKRLSEIEDAGAKTRIHGDYHLGQVLRSSKGWMVLDFEGEPLRSLSARRAKQTPLKDVAGMLRSLNYVTVATMFQRTEDGSDEWKRLEPWGRVWEETARDRFLAAYLTRAHEGRFLPHEREDLLVLLDALEIEKALYELEYEKGHRPEWIQIPRHGLIRVVERAGIR
ncbi:MAG TPA: phosphotransferase [Actinomycetota bacterium]|nr:phosphotransferase [Actinomycetota bacterium]